MWLGLDIGERRTGIATSTSGQLATPRGTLVGSLANQITKLIEIIDQESVQTIVVGTPRPGQPLPLHIEEFLTSLRKGLGARPVALVFTDETLTTKEVERRLSPRAIKKADTDALAAQLILEDYLAEQQS